MPNVNDDILQEHISALAWWNKEDEDGSMFPGPPHSLLRAANYFYNRMQAAEQAAANLAEALKKPPITDEVKFQEGYVTAVEDYKSYIPGGQETVDRLKRRW